MGSIKIVSVLMILGLLGTIGAKAETFDSSWEMANALEVQDFFLRLYLPHAKALLDAEAEIISGKYDQDLAKRLSKLPGVKAGITMNSKDGKCFIETMQKGLDEKIVKSWMDDERLFKTYLSPMMHKMLGGKCRYEWFDLDSEQESALVRAFYPKSNDQTEKVILAVVLDKSWLIPQIPVLLDSLYRENAQLLFWADSPTNKFWKQTIGIVNGHDTLWWVGERQDYISRCAQVLWPFEDIKIESGLMKIGD